MSWRDSASHVAQDDLDHLVGVSLERARLSLDERGEFYPFAMTVGIDGETRLVMAGPDEGDHPSSSVVIERLVAGMKSHRAEIRAAALVCDTRSTSSDAIRVDTEHIDGTSITIVMPYTRKRFRGAYEYDAVVAAPGTPFVFAV